ncbi:phosphoribosylanthranilate isomerase [Leptolyngbya iicbica]|uniref:N-(5'-phosphoribosyl)anthranilate isomerase n=2 Tax=Cyanophyceae TaxID=3028117 RepID=A0A4Q7EGP8_9CYAN|nr:phosphoribosylanthranilate isomerase [Leptolyngbya sp. LK]RZM83074.1 phosphoribosylanthranilate isomerase [Leptolyngbya sp. LK]
MACVDSSLWVKICGLTVPGQAVEIARQGASAIGFISAPKSPRYVTPLQIQAISEALLAAGYDQVERVGVFVDASLDDLQIVAMTGQLTTLQLHGQESPTYCQQLRQCLPHVKLIKAFRIRNDTDLAAIRPYEDVVDALLLDAYHPHLQGGTGETLDWRSLQTFRPAQPWILAGGINPDNIAEALQLTHPDGIDLSSGVELNPGNKCLQKTQQLFTRLQQLPALPAP